MKFLSLLLVAILFPICLIAQEVTVTGQVIDEASISLTGVNVVEKGTNNGTVTDINGEFEITIKKGSSLEFSYIGYVTKEITNITKSQEINVQMEPKVQELMESVAIISGVKNQEKKYDAAFGFFSNKISALNYGVEQYNESYSKITENVFKRVETAPLSTFSIDVDRAGYSNVRRMLNNGQEVPKDAVKIEEMVNYFHYDYRNPTGEHPFSVNTEIARTPWSKDSKLVRIGIKGRDISVEKVPASNLVFLLDVSGSMGEPNKLPLLKSAMGILVNKLRDEDKVSVVVYAGSAGVALKPTPGSEKKKILKAINKLRASGSTAGGEGIIQAYKIAQEQFIKGGNNRVILATDGDFNVGASSDRAMEDLIVEKRKSGIFLTALGFGMGNYKDSKIETLADKGNGNHAYIDTVQEAHRVLGTEFFGTIYTIAKDVKIQVEFNPNKVQAYRLIGYENRLLNDEDFNDDEKDAGELGSGHTVTALYEIIPVGVDSPFVKKVDDLKYSAPTGSTEFNDELLTVKFRYKEPDGDTSKLIVRSVMDTNKDIALASPDFRFAAAVALFGQQLRESVFINTQKASDVVELAEMSRGTDKDGYRAEFIRLVKSSN